MLKIADIVHRPNNTAPIRHDNNIGALRLFGALLVLFGHCWPLTSGKLALDPLSAFLVAHNISSHPIHELGVCLFFTLSGFLISQSFDCRKTALKYLEARLLRIFPALIALVVITVFVLGPTQTTQPLADYFSSKVTWTYLGNTASLRHVEYDLPGVFEALPIDSVNGSLWTLRAEFKFYLWVMAFGLLGLIRKPAYFNTVALILAGLFVSEIAPERFYKQFISLNAAFLGGYFLLGAFAYVNRKKIALSASLLVALVVISALLHNTAAYHIAFGITFGYLVLLVAYHPKIKLPIVDRHGDFSYGVYLYAFPLQQTLIYRFHV
jgi:peptidoglycan/LPS O-acetylase OafA/YrhL